MVGADGNYEHSESTVVTGKGYGTKHTLFSETETIIWVADNNTQEITEVKHLGR